MIVRIRRGRPSCAGIDANMSPAIASLPSIRGRARGGAARAAGLDGACRHPDAVPGLAQAVKQAFFTQFVVPAFSKARTATTAPRRGTTRCSRCGRRRVTPGSQGWRPGRFTRPSSPGPDRSKRLNSGIGTDISPPWSPSPRRTPSGALARQGCHQLTRVFLWCPVVETATSAERELCGRASSHMGGIPTTRRPCALAASARVPSWVAITRSSFVMSFHRSAVAR